MRDKSSDGGTIQDVLDALKEQGERIARLENPATATPSVAVGIPYAGVSTDEHPAFCVYDVSGQPYSHHNTLADAENYVRVMRNQGVGGLSAKATP